MNVVFGLFSIIALFLSILSALFCVRMERRITAAVAQNLVNSLTKWSDDFSRQTNLAIEAAVQKRAPLPTPEQLAKSFSPQAPATAPKPRRRRARS